MSDSSKDNQIENSIFTITKILDSAAPLEALSKLNANMAQASGLTTLNAAANQQQMNILSTAIVAAGAHRVLGTNSSEKDEKLSPKEYLDCLQKLLSIAKAGSQENAAKTPEESPQETPDNSSNE